MKRGRNVSQKRVVKDQCDISSLQGMSQNFPEPHERRVWWVSNATPHSLRRQSNG